MYADKLLMRLFTGIDLPESVVQHLERLLAHLRPTADLKWSPLPNLHITTKFIGEYPPDRLPELNQALQPTAQRSAIPISLDGLGWYPTPHAPHGFFAAVHAGPALPALAAAIDAALAPLGVPRETKPFSPHLTLARIKPGAPLQSLREAVANLESTQFGQFEAARFHLYHSQPGAAGSVYAKLSTFPFAE
jgi:2'-5' RNA ligase